MIDGEELARPPMRALIWGTLRHLGAPADLLAKYTEPNCVGHPISIRMPEIGATLQIALCASPFGAPDIRIPHEKYAADTVEAVKILRDIGARYWENFKASPDGAELIKFNSGAFERMRVRESPFSFYFTESAPARVHIDHIYMRDDGQLLHL